MSAGGGCEAAVTARRCGCAKLMECCEALYERFPPKLKGAVYKSYVRPAILHGSKAWRLEERDGNLTKDREIHGDSNVTAQRYKKI